MARHQGNRKVKGAIPIIIGAGITEQYYFQHLNNLGYFKCRVRPRFNLKGRENAHELSKKIKQALEETEGKVFCVVDYDVLSKNPEQASKIEELFKAYSGRVIQITSMPCFEYWLLLHFEKNYGVFESCKPIEERLKKHLPSYQKVKKFLEKGTWVENLEPHRHTARQRALIGSDATSEGGAWTHVYKVFEQK